MRAKKSTPPIKTSMAKGLGVAQGPLPLPTKITARVLAKGKKKTPRWPRVPAEPEEPAAHPEKHR